MTFLEKLNNYTNKNKSLLCIGLDTDIKKVPSYILKTKDPLLNFNKEIINATFNLVCCYKINIAYYSALGVYGLKALQQTIDYIHKECKLPVILDAKRADIGNTSEQYASEAFEVLNSDAVTVNPYLGFDAIEPFLKYKNKGIIILCRTSNKGAMDFQDLQIEKTPLYIKVAKEIIKWNQKYKNCLMVFGATWSNELKLLRRLAPSMFFLVPGVGAQGADLKQTLKAGLNKDRSGLIIHSARAIIYASNDKNFAKKASQKAKEIKDLINAYRYE